MATLSEQLVALEQMTVGELAEKFREVFGFPTRTRNKSYLRKRLSWQIQAAEGGPVAARPRQNRGAGTAGSGSVAARAGIRRCARRWRADPGTTTRSRLPAIGSTVVRVHQGVEHQVTVLADGFEYQGQRHASLSQIARLITGTPWNGFLFFGLQRRPGTGQPEEACA